MMTEAQIRAKRDAAIALATTKKRSTTSAKHSWQMVAFALDWVLDNATDLNPVTDLGAE